MPSGATVRATQGVSLVHAAIQAGVEVEAVCGGRGVCGKCRGRLLQGATTAVSDREEKLLSPEELETGHILLCQRFVSADAVLEVTPQAEGAAFCHDGKDQFTTLEELRIEPHVEKAHQGLPPATLQDQASDLDRVLRALPAGVKAGPLLVRGIPRSMDGSRWSVTSVLFHNELVAVEEGDTSLEAYGMALDIGTTTVAGYLVDLFKGKALCSASATNRQSLYGADVLSRVSYATSHSNGLAEMQRLVIQTVDHLIERLLKEGSVPPEKVYFLTFVGNTIMAHLLAGVSPKRIALAPFIPVFTGTLTGVSQDLGLTALLPSTRFAILPGVSGYIGSDTVGMILATGIHERPGAWLAVDIGTNGEVALSCDGRLLTCSTAAGPAFEGGTIRQGMRAAQGAIYRVDMQGGVHISVVGDGEPLGICGSGLVDTVSEMARLGLITDMGRLKNPADSLEPLSPELRSRIRRTGEGYSFDLAKGERGVALSQQDISALQLAKGAMKAGVDILLEELGIAASDLNGVFLAGAFGTHLRPESILGIGLLPEGVPVNRIQPVGNAAGAGAVMSLLSREATEKAASLAKRCEHIELSAHRHFSDRFARALRFQVGKRG